MDTENTGSGRSETDAGSLNENSEFKSADGRIRFFKVFNFKTPDARGRVYLLIATAIQSLLYYVTTGIFYTGFLKEYGMDVSDVNILAFIPFFAGVFVIFTPEILVHLKKRKWVLAGCYVMYYLLLFVGITLLPQLVESNSGRLLGLILLTFFANLFYIIGTAGYSAWHVRFMPEEIRSYCLSAIQILGATIAGVFALVSGRISDSLEGIEGGQLGFLIKLRYIALAIGIVHCVFLLLPREVEYPVIRMPRFADIFTVPARNKKFMLTMVIVFMWQFSLNLSNASTWLYMLETIKMGYTFFNLIIFLYAVVFFFCAGFWRKVIARTSWFKTFALTMLLVGPTQIALGFMQPGHFVVLVLTVRLIQHFAGAGHNVVFANFQYINMPVTNRTCYTSLYNIIVQAGSMAGVAAALIILKYTKNLSVHLFGYTYTTGVPLLICLTGVIELLIAVYIFALGNRLEPDAGTERA